MSAPKVDSTDDGRVLDLLFEVVESRRETAPEGSHSAKMFARGPKKIAQKLGEEAVEVALEGDTGTHEELVAESADLLYHLILLWSARGLRPQAVWAELARRHAERNRAG